MKCIVTNGLFIIAALAICATLQAQTPYWTEGFEDGTLFPSSGKTTNPTQVVTANGSWILYYTYRTTASSGAPVGTADIRLVKTASVSNPTDGPFCYLVTPVVLNGVGTISFYEGRGARQITIEKSLDGGTTWILVGVDTTVAKAQNPTVVNDALANRIRVSDQWTSDADIDEFSITPFEQTAVSATEFMPMQYNLEQNYPNPFNPTTTIAFHLDRDSRVNLSVYNMQGQMAANMVNGFLPAGRHEAIFRADQLPTGVYVYCLTTATHSMFKKMVLMK